MTADALPCRVRFAKRELLRLAEAVELCETSRLDPWLRVLELEDQLADVRAQAIEWRHNYEALKALIAAGG